MYLPNKCFLKNSEDPERVCKGTRLDCTHHPCPQCPIHGHNLLLPPALSSSTGQAGWGCRSRRLALGICATLSLRQDISHHTQALATCPPPAWERHLWSKTPLNWSEKMDKKVQCSWVCQKYFTYQTTQLSWAERPLAERNCGTGNLGSFRCAYQAVAKTKVAVLTCEKSSDERLLPNRRNSLNTFCFLVLVPEDVCVSWL